jgi:hypothetical protein
MWNKAFTQRAFARAIRCTGSLRSPMVLTRWLSSEYVVWKEIRVATGERTKRIGCVIVTGQWI